MNEWSTIISIGALLVSVATIFARAAEKNLSIREHDAYREAVARDIHRVEARLGHLEQTRPTTGELEILSDALNKRMDEMVRRFKP